jgi:hypothetical protein
VLKKILENCEDGVKIFKYSVEIIIKIIKRINMGDKRI